MSSQSLLLAQEVPEISDIQVYQVHDSVKCSFRIPDLFSGDVEETLLSGLPVLIEERYLYQGEQNKTINTRIHKFRITYDIWEDLFTLEQASGFHQFPDLDSLTRWWNPREEVFLSSVSRLENVGEAFLTIRVRIVLLSRAEGEKLKDWIFHSQETEESLPTQNRDTGFTLNLNRLLSIFFRKEDVAREIIVQGMSPIPESIKKF